MFSSTRQLTKAVAKLSTLPEHQLQALDNALNSK
jgi:hypothetical protein